MPSMLRTAMGTALVVGAVAGAISGLIVAIALDDDPPRVTVSTAIEPAPADASVDPMTASDASAEPGPADSEATPTGGADAASAGATAPAATDDGASGIEAAVQRVLPSIVAVEVIEPERRNAEGQIVQRISLGTGMVVDAAGYVLTNEHVIRDGLGPDGALVANVIVHLASGEERKATLVSHDGPFTDLAVLRIAPGGLTPVDFGPSSALRFGQPVIAIGNALQATEPSVTVGVISNPATSFPREDFLQEFLIQTDAALNQGNSGGALITLDGRVVGLTTTIVRETVGGSFVDGVGFALQADEIVPIILRIIRDGVFPRPSLGIVQARTLTPEIRTELGIPPIEGALLIGLEPQGPLARAGLRPGDIVRTLGKYVISETFPWLNALRRLAPGDTLDVTFSRPSGEAGRVTVTAETRAS